MKLLTYGIYLVVLCLPLYLVRFEVFGIPTTVLEVMIYALFIVWLGQRGYKGMQGDIKGYKGVILPIILIIIGVSLATVFSLDLQTSAGIWKGWFVDPLLLFVVLVTTIRKPGQIKGVLYSLFLSGAVVSVISLIYLIQGRLDPFGRLQAFYNSPNYLAMYLVPALIIGAGFLFQKMAKLKIIPKTFILLPIVCLLLSVFFTKSFGAWLGIIAAVCFGLVFYLYKSGRKKFALTILYLALLIIVFLGYYTLIQKESSFDTRLIIWQKAGQVFKANPILGIGPGTFGNYFPSYPEWGVPQPHSIYLAFLLQTGIIGFIGFIWLLIWFFRIGVKWFIVHSSRFMVILMSIMVYILVHGLVDATYWKNDLSVLFWTIIGLMAVFRHLKIRHFIR